MDAHTPLLAMARYNRWMNERLYEACAGMADAERRRERGAFFRSVHGTLDHLLLADRIWLSRFLGTPSPTVRSLGDELYADFDELRRERARTDDAIDAWIAGLDAERLAGPLEFRSVVASSDRVLPLWVAALHFFNHQTHHRGQLTALLTQCGVDYGVTDLMWMPGEPWSLPM